MPWPASIAAVTPLFISISMLMESRITKIMGYYGLPGMAGYGLLANLSIKGQTFTPSANMNMNVRNTNVMKNNSYYGGISRTCKDRAGVA